MLRIEQLRILAAVALCSLNGHARNARRDEARGNLPSLRVMQLPDNGRGDSFIGFNGGSIEFLPNENSRLSDGRPLLPSIEKGGIQ